MGCAAGCDGVSSRIWGGLVEAEAGAYPGERGLTNFVVGIKAWEPIAEKEAA
jgi:hypothetical protein